MCQMPLVAQSRRTGQTVPIRRPHSRSMKSPVPPDPTSTVPGPWPRVSGLWSLVHGPWTVPTDRLNAWKLFMSVSCVYVWVCGVFEFNWFLMCMQTSGPGRSGNDEVCGRRTQYKINNHMGHYFGVAVCISQFAAVYCCIHLAWLGLLFNKLVDLWLIKLVAVLIYACLRAHAQWPPQWVIATVAAWPSEWISWLMITKLGWVCCS